MVKNLLALISLLIGTSPGIFAQIKHLRPNIVWIVCEDISPTLSMYGDSTAKTPNLDALASSGITYTNAFTTAGVCAPSRSAIITGMMQTGIGTMHMRAGDDVFSWGKRTYSRIKGITDINGDTISQYSAVVPPEIKCFTEYLRKEGYYCTNNAKTDYQFASPLSAWDENGNKAHWRNRKPGQPFFSVINIGVTHESRLWLNDSLELTVDPGIVPVPPYLQDTDTSRHTIARHYSNVMLMDQRVGEILTQLKKDALYDSTVIFFYSDHGGPLPRQKRELFDSGLKVPLLIKPAGEIASNHLEDDLVSFIDLAPTVLSLAGIKPPGYMEGRAFMGMFESPLKREYIYAASDRLDECTDRIRVLRDKRFLYVCNYYPEKSHYEDIGYRKNIPLMREMLNMKSQNLLSNEQLRWFEPKAVEELYDCEKDPFNMTNLKNNPDYRNILDRFRKAYISSDFYKKDLGKVSESELIDSMWPGGIQPETLVPEVEITGGLITIKCSASGASISYRFSDLPDEKFDFDLDWNLYSQPVKISDYNFIYIVAEQIGYKISKQVIIKLN